ncbi:uncharacterized protein FFB14_12725 [Fusarium fujikuroi]|nr:uncharacterized protein FFB14_12725 [Fusarium fujikuroi]
MSRSGQAKLAVYKDRAENALPPPVSHQSPACFSASPNWLANTHKTLNFSGLQVF